MPRPSGALRVLVLFAVAACAEEDPRARPDAAPDAGPDAALDWMNGGADLPEYSLGRLLISHAEAPELTLFDLDTSKVAGSIPFDARAEVEAGTSGRYGYAFGPSRGVLHVVDPGQWLLSHIDHFHVMRGEHRLMAEQVSMPMLSSLIAHDGWVTAHAASSGAVAFFQERSITARSFAPSTLALAASSSAGTALVSRAQLLGSDGAALRQRSVFDPATVIASFEGCTDPRGAAAHAERVFVGCAEGLLQLTWDATQELFVAELSPIAEGVTAVSTTERLDGAVLQIGARSIGLVGAAGSALRRVELGSDVAALALRRQASAAIVLTVDGTAHELALQTGTVTRSVAALSNAQLARLALSHAYAYITDPRAPRVVVLRLRTMQLEGELALGSPAHDLALVGVPSSYTDERE